MLVLSRFKDEEICIGDHVRVVIVDVRNDPEGGKPKVRLGIVAPDSIAVDRKEIRDRKLAEAAQASQAKSPPTMPPKKKRRRTRTPRALRRSRNGNF